MTIHFIISEKHWCSAYISLVLIKILITHGTDTMIETAAFIAKNVTDKAIVLCGALRPEAFKNSDADFNIGCAVGALNVAPPGVYVTMSGRVHPWDLVKRDMQSGQFVNT